MASPKRLTKKQAAFRDAILAGFNPSEAYRKAFDAKAMSKKAVSVEAARLLKHDAITLAITLATSNKTTPAVLPPPPPAILVDRQRRMEELSYAALLDPAELFDDLNHFRPIKELPEHVRRAIAGFEVDPVSFVLKIKFVDKRGAIMDYSKLAGDIPKEKEPPKVPALAEDLTNWTAEDLETYKKLKAKLVTKVVDVK